MILLIRSNWRVHHGLSLRDVVRWMMQVWNVLIHVWIPLLDLHSYWVIILWWIRRAEVVLGDASIEVVMCGRSWIEVTLAIV